MSEVRTKLGEGGRIVVPATYRRALGLKPGDDVLIVLEGVTLRLLTPREAARRAQALVRQFVRKGRKLSRELLEERKEEGRGG